MSQEHYPLADELLHFVIPDSTKGELLRRLGYFSQLPDSPDLMVLEVAQITGHSPELVFKMLLDISESKEVFKPNSDRDRIEQLERELEETKRILGKIPSRFKLEPTQRMAQMMISLIVVVIIVFFVFAISENLKPKANSSLRRKAEIFSTESNGKMTTVYDDFTVETTENGVKRPATESEEAQALLFYEQTKQKR